MTQDAGHGSDALGPVDMRDPGFRQDPHALLRDIRERGRVRRDVLGIWLLTHHADCSAGLRSTQLSREVWRLPSYRQLRPFLADSTLERIVESWMLFNDPPRHTRLRRLVNGAFRPPVIEALRARIGAVTDALLDALPPGEPFDLMTSLAQPLPVRVICDILGLPPEDFALTKAWSDALAFVAEPVTRKELRVAADDAAREMVDYLRGHLTRHRQRGNRDDVLGMLIAAQDEDGRISEDELLGNLVLLFIAGHETTTNLIGNGMLTLLGNPAEAARIRAEPSLLPTAVEEMLRFEGSVNMVARHTFERYAVGDVEIPANETIFFMVGAANRDPAVFREPDRFDAGRSPNPHLGFGAGIHYCIGAPLARLEAEIVFGRLLARFATIEAVDAQVRWRRLINLRGLEQLMLRGSA